MNRAIAILVLVLALGLPAAPALGQTSVSGTISADTTWTKAGSPYVLSGQVRFVDSARLTIEPGVRVEAQQGSSLVMDNAGLTAEGTADEPIVFTSRSGVVDWAGVRLFPDHGPYPTMRQDRFSHVQISNASNALEVAGARVALAEFITFDGNHRALLLDNPNEDFALTDSILINNDVAISGRTWATTSIYRNDLWNNVVNILAVPQDPHETCGDGGLWDIHDNDILRGPVNNSYWSYDVKTPRGSGTSSYEISATGNWWGTADESRLYGRFDPQFRCCPEHSLKEIVWSPVSSQPNTSWEPPGEVPDPEPEGQGHADPIGWTEVDAPDDRSCIDRHNLRYIRASLYQALGNPDSVRFKIERHDASGCKTWSDRRERFLMGCHRWVPATKTRRGYVYELPRALIQGVYKIRSSYDEEGFGPEPRNPGVNQVRLLLL